MSEHSIDNEFDRPFPAMTPGQRYHLDVFGYVVIENTLTEEETGRLLEAMQRLKTDLLAVEPDAYVRGCRLGAHRPHYLHFAHILEADPAIYDYLTHPRLVGLAEELVGGIVRLEESEAIINERDPDAEWDGRYGFHVGTWPDLGTYTENGLFHCTFVKTLTNLTELGPDDGGTVVVAGSHKIKAPREEITASAYEDRSLIHQVVAPAGSTLLFGEALIHATGRIGQPKVESARHAIAEINPEVRLIPHRMRLGPDNVMALIADFDVIADGSDNFETRFLLNDACHVGARTLVSAAILRFEGQLSTFKSHLGHDHPCYRCLYREPPPPGLVPSCSEGGVLGALAGVMGSLQTTEVLKELLGIGNSLSGHLVIYDALDTNFRKMRLKRDAGCPLCGDAPTITLSSLQEGAHAGAG